MKKFTYLIYATLLLALSGACKNGEDMMTDDNFHPRIIDNSGVFNAPSRIINQGQSAIYTGLTFSPKPFEKSKIVWTLNDVEVSNDTAYTFTPTTGGEYQLKLTATYNGQTSTRLSKILVSPESYTPKTYTNVAMSYLSEEGKAAAVNWAEVTHVAFNGARVISSSSVDFSKSIQAQNGDEIVARGHINGVPVLLGVSGRLSGVDGWSLYNSTDFGTAILTADGRTTLAGLIAAHVIAHKFDGVDIMMTDLSNDSYDASASHARAVTPFIAALKAALPAGSLVTATVTTNYMHWEYGDLSAADWLNVHAFEVGTNVGPGAPRAQGSTYSYMVDCAAIWLNKGIPANKLVIGMPAFGVRYTAIDANGNNLSWGSYDYLTYKAIVALDAAAPEKEYAAGIAEGVYYNGVPLITQKAQYIRDNGFKGGYLWAGDYDMTGNGSLTTAIHSFLK